MDQLLRLDEVARLTGQPLERLRQWCATGELACERVPTSWALRKADLPKVAGLAAARVQGFIDHRPVALAVPRGHVPRDMVGLVARALDLRPGEVAMRGLAIDNLDFVVAVWPAGTSLGDHAALIALAQELDGELLTESSPGDLRRPAERRVAPAMTAIPGSR